MGNGVHAISFERSPKPNDDAGFVFTFDPEAVISVVEVLLWLKGLPPDSWIIGLSTKGHALYAILGHYGGICRHIKSQTGRHVLKKDFHGTLGPGL
jgi:hypothetical protein